WLLLSGSSGDPKSATSRASVESGASGRRPGPEPDWTILEADYCGSSVPGGATLTKLPDQSILASGPILNRELYIFRASTPLTGVTGVRLEVLPHPSLPGQQGPGRSTGGNFVLNQFKVLISPAGLDQSKATPVVLSRAWADFAQEDFPVTNSIDGLGQRGWAIWGGVGTAHVAVFELKESFGFAKGTAITCKLEHDYPGNPDPHPLGRFRISVTTRKPPLSLESAVPASESTAKNGRVVFRDD